MNVQKTRKNTAKEKIFKKIKKGIAFLKHLCYNNQGQLNKTHPGVAQFGSALEWGSRGRWFDSSHSDLTA